MNIYDEKLEELKRKNELISRKLEDIQLNNQPLLEEVHPGQNYEPEQNFFKYIKQQKQQINAKIQSAQQQFKAQEKVWEKEEKKRKQTIFHKPVIKSKEQVEQENKIKEEKRLNKFINDMMEKYEPYLQKTAPVSDAQERLQEIQQKKLEQFRQKKQVMTQQEKALQSKQLAEFGQSKMATKPLVQDFIAMTDNHEDQQIIEQANQDQRNRQRKALFFTILNEKTKSDNITLKKNFDKIINMIFSLDRERCGYISKDELLTYFGKYSIFIDIFDLDWNKFKEFVLKVKAIRRGLLNKAKLKQILIDKKLKASTEEIRNRIQARKAQQYEVPEIQPTVQVEDQSQEVQKRDEEIDFKQLDELTDLNKQYQDLNFPLYHEVNNDQKKIILNEQKQEQKILDPKFVEFNLQIYELQKQYKKGLLN